MKQCLARPLPISGEGLLLFNLEIKDVTIIVCSYFYVKKRRSDGSLKQKKKLFLMVAFLMLSKLFLLAMLTLEVKNPPRFQHLFGLIPVSYSLNYTEVPPRR